MTLFLFVNHLFGRKSRQCFGIPVHHTHTAVDESFVIKIHKHLDDTLGTRLIHGEGCSVPIARSTQTAQLLQDDSSMLMRPVPCMFQELIASQVVFLDSLLSEFLYHLGFRSNTGMVGSGNPACVLAFHSGPSYENILNGIVKHVTHVEYASYVWRWDDNRIGFSTIRFRTEQFVVNPILVPF